MTAYALRSPTEFKVRALTVSLNLEQLLQRSQVSDPLVSEALVQQHYAFVYRLALSILDDPDEAEDATQETIIAAVVNLDRRRGESSLKTWMRACPDSRPSLPASSGKTQMLPLGRCWSQRVGPMTTGTSKRHAWLKVSRACPTARFLAATSTWLSSPG